jgi:hypothetical protein
MMRDPLIQVRNKGGGRRRRGRRRRKKEELIVHVSTRVLTYSPTHVAPPHTCVPTSPFKNRVSMSTEVAAGGIFPLISLLSWPGTA